MVIKSINKKFTAPVLLSITLAIAGCQQPSRQGTFADSVRKNPPYAADIRHLTAGKSVRQRDINYTVHGSGKNVTLVIAGIHGDEKAGVVIAHKLDSFLAERPYSVIGRTVVILPIANPDGYIKNTRFNARNIDINRNFATFNRIDNEVNGRGGMTEPESIALAKIINTYNPSKIISLHSTLACIDYDGPSEVVARRMSKKCSLPVKKLGSRPGSLGSYAGLEKKIPMVTVEFTAKDEKLDADRLWAKYEKAILAGIYYELKQDDSEGKGNAADSDIRESDTQPDDRAIRYH